MAINRYDEYGIPGAGNIGRFQYTGQAWLEDLGMYHYKARIYSPTLGRFLQTDPIGYEDQIKSAMRIRSICMRMSEMIRSMGAIQLGNRPLFRVMMVGGLSLFIRSGHTRMLRSGTVRMERLVIGMRAR